MTRAWTAWSSRRAGVRPMSSGERMKAGVVAESVYRLDDRLYVNVTSRCALRCRFCFKWQDRPDFFGHHLLMSSEAEPSLEALDRAIRDAPPHSELVFCGLGEPLERFADVAELAARYRLRGGGRVRVNTCGVMTPPPVDAALRYLAAHVDCLAVSLNAPDRTGYDALCRPARPDAHPELMSFIERSRNIFSTVLLTAVAYPGADLEGCRRVAAELRLPFGLRPFSSPEPCGQATRPAPVRLGDPEQQR